MYYKSVNRGLSFTKPGFYAIGYVMLLGILAIISGVNGLYLFLSAGLSFLIISGMLSERVMRYNKVISISEVETQANTPFKLTYTVQNKSPSFTTYGLDTYFLFEVVKVKTMNADIDAPIKGNIARLKPGQELTMTANCTGLERCRKQELVVFTKTGFPFGFLEKYSFSKFQCSLTVGPEIDEDLLKSFDQEIKSTLLTDAHEDFYSHRSYHQTDSRKKIDWKKSASKPVSNWVVRQFRSEQHQDKITIILNMNSLEKTANEVAYERILIEISTLRKALLASGLQIQLYVEGHGCVVSERINGFLAAIPEHSERSKIGGYLKEVSFVGNEVQNTIEIVNGKLHISKVTRKSA